MRSTASDRFSTDRERDAVRRRVAYRLMAVPFAAVTVFCIAIFVAGLVEREFRTSLPVYILLLGTSAVGLWLERTWGRSIGLIVAVGNAGIAALAVLASMLAGDLDGRSLVLLVASVGIAWTLTTEPFTLPDERPLRAPSQEVDR